MIHRFCIIFSLTFACSSGLWAQGNEKYLFDSLSRKREVLELRRAGHERNLAEGRRRFAAAGTDRDRVGAEIIRLEGDLARLRDTLGRVNEALRALGNRFATDTGHSFDDEGAGLAGSGYVRGLLPEEEHRQLEENIARELAAQELLDEIIENYARLAALSKLYEEEEAQHSADSLFRLVVALRGENHALVETFARQWEDIFDERLYLYNLILDAAGRSDALTEMERAMRRASGEVARTAGEYMYDPLSAYYPHKELLFQYERRIAESGGLTVAADSLSTIMRGFRAERFRLPALETEERLFLDYADYTVSPAPIYNATNPIPQVVVYPKGTIYRVFAGAFGTPQPASAFRNVAPLATEVMNRLHHYYIGGYRTHEEAESAAARLRTAGIRNPRVVVWRDGVYDADPVAPQPPKPQFRVEITGIERIPAPVAELIRIAAPDNELVRRTDSEGRPLFTVDALDKAAADKLAEEIKRTDSRLQVRVTEG